MDDLFGDVPVQTAGNSTSSASTSALSTDEFDSVLLTFAAIVPIYTGRCRVVETTKAGKSTLTIKLEDSNTGELFAQCPYDLAGKAVEPTLDSSRYFALRVIDVNSGKSAYLGMGFRERPEAFDFQVALQDWQKQQRAPKFDPSDSTSATSSSKSPHIPDGPKRDFTLKAGETISVKLGSGAGPSVTTKKSSSSNAGGPIPLLAPPPSAPKKR
ncbi:hypothetical protein EMMF5_000120 [Cystobasidiomycetes sp. EMM_F5]